MCRHYGTAATAGTSSIFQREYLRLPILNENHFTNENHSYILLPPQGLTHSTMDANGNKMLKKSERMPCSRRASHLCGSLALFLSAAVSAEEPPSAVDREVIIVGGYQEAYETAGSAHFVGPEELLKFNYSDIQDIIREVPGVSVQLEDGYGLRPNLSIRGTAAERSGKVTLMEDGVLIAPAPYSAPSAYYFPTAGRMHAFEVLKGPATITQGPYTTGGAVNMISTPIPRDMGGGLLIEGGGYSDHRLHAHAGFTSDSGVGLMFETHDWASDGFQKIDRDGGNTGLDVQDHTFKIRYTTPDSRHQLDFKYQYADQSSDQSYLGLTDADFRKPTPTAATACRSWTTSRPSTTSTSSATASSPATHWRSRSPPTTTNTNGTGSRPKACTLTDSKIPMIKRTRVGTTSSRPSTGTRFLETTGPSMKTGITCRMTHMSLWMQTNLWIAWQATEPTPEPATPRNSCSRSSTATLDTEPGGIELKHNSREYFSRGVQLRLDWQGTVGGTEHDLEIGFRYHEDEEDRIQRLDSYSQVDGQLVLHEAGDWGHQNAGNRLQEAEAIAVYVHDRIEWGPWVFSPGFRYEDIDQKRTRWKDPEPDDVRANFRSTRKNDTSVFLPGMGVLFNVDSHWVLLAGYHKGFAAPSNEPGIDEEESDNFELGVRYANSHMRGEVIAFHHDYENIIGICTASSGANCEIGDNFNGGEATVEGVEAMFATDVPVSETLNLPLSLSYTYMDTEFDSNFEDGFFGEVSKGDPIPYIPEHQLRVSMGLEGPEWSVNLSGKYTDEVCVRATCELSRKPTHPSPLTWPAVIG